jgi:RHS repeat-associated protein
MVMPVREFVASEDYRYGFNGKEKEANITNSESHYDFGARVYDGRIGRWWSVDPLGLNYPETSPYNFVNNQVLIAVDPDGKKILFVNGYWCDGRCGDIIGANQAGAPYWGGGFQQAAQRFFSDYGTIGANNYIDGSSDFGGDEDGAERFARGREYGRTHLQELTSGLVTGETIKILTHSEGAAMGAGVADFLIESGFNVEFVVHLSPDEGSDFQTPELPITYQLSYSDDPVTVESVISGVDKQGVIHDPAIPLMNQHGQTGGQGIFTHLQDLITAKVDKTLTWCADKNSAVILNTQNSASTPNGTQFSEIDGTELFDANTCEPIDK